jgi:hypothetical protein
MKVPVHGANAGNQVVFECANGTFGGGVAVNVWWRELEFDARLRHERLEGKGCSIVKAFQDRFETTSFKEGHRLLERCNSGGSGVIRHWHGVSC